jgi:stage V sporulation protein S
MIVAQADDVEELTILRVSSSSAPQAVAAAVSKSIFDSHTYPTLRAIGHGAVGQAAKALAIARGYTAARGLDLAFTIGFDTILNDDGKEISAIVFHTFRR